jgi:hypothetical protein
MPIGEFRGKIDQPYKLIVCLHIPIDTRTVLMDNRLRQKQTSLAPKFLIK